MAIAYLPHIAIPSGHFSFLCGGCGGASIFFACKMKCKVKMDDIELLMMRFILINVSLFYLTFSEKDDSGVKLHSHLT